MPRQVRPGETGAPPLALNLHYLVTAYGRGESDNDAVSHRVLGGAMSVMHDHPLLSRSELSAALAGNDLGEQFERLKITQLPMPLDEMSKLWMVFQTQYRISAAYQVTVVLIDSRAPVKAPLPVLPAGRSRPRPDDHRRAPAHPEGGSSASLAASGPARGRRRHRRRSADDGGRDHPLHQRAPHAANRAGAGNWPEPR